MSKNEWKSDENNLWSLTFSLIFFKHKFKRQCIVFAWIAVAGEGQKYESV